MTGESLCTYEQGSRLKRLGYDWPCWCVFERDSTGPFPFRVNQPSNFNANIYGISAPTTDSAHRWLRDVMQVSITVNPQRNTDGKPGFNFTVFDLTNQSPAGWAYDIFPTYEDAMLAALDYAIEYALIQKGKLTAKK